jgi:hypothetical protein
LGNRYTAVLTLSEKTATAIENRLKKTTEYFIIKFKIYFLYLIIIIIKFNKNNKKKYNFLLIITAILRQT